jgi:hypothetical protein
MMGWVLGVTALGVAAANLVVYRRKMEALRVPLRPRGPQALMAAAGAAGVLALGLAPGVLGGLAAVTTLLLAVLFLLLTATSGLPQPGRVLAVGRPAPEFAGLDADGHEFRLSERRGSRVLLKFFRGGW